jgi:pimeloyl-ACP methyl ester carboxylesterase
MYLLHYFTAAAGAASVAGYAYETMSSRRDARNYPPTGELVEVEGRTLHVHIEGTPKEGVPTVIIETGIFDCSCSWKLVRSKLAEKTQVFSYDRAGYGWSPRGTCPRTFQRIGKELQSVLESKGIKPPYLLIGHSLGGPLVRYFHSQHPRDVAGIIFVDALHDTMPQMPRIFMIVARAFSYLSIVGIPRLIFQMMPKFTKNEQWTSEMQKAYIAAHFVRSSSLATCFDESDSMRESFIALTMKKQSLDNIPVTLISRDPDQAIRPGLSEEAKQKIKNELEDLHTQQKNDMPNAKFTIAKRSSHTVQLDRPDVIIAEVYEMLDAISKK